MMIDSHLFDISTSLEIIFTLLYDTSTFSIRSNHKWIDFKIFRRSSYLIWVSKRFHISHLEKKSSLSKRDSFFSVFNFMKRSRLTSFLQLAAFVLMRDLIECKEANSSKRRARLSSHHFSSRSRVLHLLFDHLDHLDHLYCLDHFYYLDHLYLDHLNYLEHFDCFCLHCLVLDFHFRESLVHVVLVLVLVFVSRLNSLDE